MTGDLAGDLSDMSTLLRGYRAHGLVADRTDARLLAAFEADFNDYVAKTAAFRALADNGQIAAAGAVVGSGPGDKAYDALKAASVAWQDYRVKSAAAAAAASRASYTSGVTLISILLVVAMCIAAAIALLISRRLSKAVRDVGKVRVRSREARLISMSRFAATTSSERWRLTSPRWSTISGPPSVPPSDSPPATCRGT